MTARRVGAVLLGCLLGLALEHAAVGMGYRAYFAGAWELGPARSAAAPLFLAAMVPLAVAFAGLFTLAERGSRRFLAAVLGAAAAAVGLGVTNGRHFASLALRVPFVLLVAAAGVAAGLALPRVVALGRARRGLFAGLACGVAVLAWCGDAFVLPRLYEAFHTGLFVLSLGAAGFAALFVEERLRRVRGPEVGLVLGALSLVWAPFAARRLHGYDNLRRTLVERAPWMGRAVRLAAWISPPKVDAPADVALPGEVGRALDWSGRDIVLVSVDALRADHVGAYGYARATTPHFDALAREGRLFEHAYCPTPHTSYSVTSMMTGKYMRPLLNLGLGEDSETWAAHLRRYDYRTAAFYPPAVFFIDPGRFVGFRDRGLDFEYRKEEFADPKLREQQVRGYLATAPKDKPLFLWVHFFEPHEPYVQHAEHRFGDSDVDAYDSEIAAADDGIDAIVRAVRESRPGAVVMITADHGEEFGDHGGRYHGSTVYEEQVRVPLLILGPGVLPGRVSTPVQTIDLLPTTLSALGIPRPARIRGRDLGALLAGQRTSAEDRGLAFAETDDYEMLADGPLRLLCEKRAAACSVYDVVLDPLEHVDRTAEHGADAQRLRGILAAVGHQHGRFEGQGASDLPEALRRGMQGEVDAAPEVAALLDDANVNVRRKAAQTLFDLRSNDTVAQLGRASHDDDDEVRRWTALALARCGGEVLPLVSTLLKDPDLGWSRPAALALAERGDGRGVEALALWLGAKDTSFARAREIVSALAGVKARSAVPALVLLLEDLRLRAYVADALAAIGDPAAKAPLLVRFSEERYVSTRPHEARALAALGARGELREPLARFAGVSEPMEGAVTVALAAGLLDAEHGGLRGPRGTVSVPKGTLRILLLLSKPADVHPRVDGVEVTVAPGAGTQRVVELGAREAGTLRLETEPEEGVLAVWIVARADELPPPP